VKPELIRASARFIGSARPPRWSTGPSHGLVRRRHPARARDGDPRALLGSWGAAAATSSPGSTAPGYPLPPTSSTTARRPAPADKPKTGGYPLATEVLASGLCDATKPGHALYDLKAWLVYGCNLLQAMPARQELVEKMQHLDFLAVVDVLPAEIAGWADVVLPEATYLEREDDLSAPPYKRPFVAMRQAAVEPMYDSKPVVDREGAREPRRPRRLVPWKDAKDYVAKRLALKGCRTTPSPRRGRARRAGRDVRGGGAPVGAATENGKIQLFSKELQALGFEPLPVYHPQEEGPPGTFRLLSGRAPLHTFGRTTNNRLLAEPYPRTRCG